jgi:hypothetical protein
MTRDTLSDVLRGVRLRGAVFLYITGSSEWAAEAPPAREVAPLPSRPPSSASSASRPPHGAASATRRWRDSMLGPQ